MVGESTRPTGTNEPVAVVGMSCRLPQAADPQRFWALLAGGVDAVTAVPEGRWPDAGDSEFRRGGFIADVDQFDAAFFGISPNEAAAMDPQQRLALELAWEAVENARTVPAVLGGTTAGVFIGTTSNDYAMLQAQLAASGPGRHNYTGANRAIIANRVSYVLGLQGPSLTVDTGQSSALVAVQLACESLRRGETPLAIAGGVNLNLLAETTAAIGSFGALSPDGRCYVFDSRANGYVRGEGGGFVVLKMLSAAQADGDVVHCVILGGAINNDGGGDGLTVPSRRAQESVITLACERAGVRPADVRYVELHGTGTPVGDPIEASALGATLGDGRPEGEPLLVGSVKTNIGHLEGAAGIAGLLKVALSLKHGLVPANLNFETPNPQIPFDELGLRVVASATDLRRDGRQLVAGVSSFGMGGTNCHLVLADAPSAAPPKRRKQRAGTPGQDAPWLLSARTARALAGQASSLRGHLDADEAIEPADVALSLLRSRAVFEHRAVVLGEGRADKLAALDALAGSLPDRRVVTGSVSAGGCAFVFPGQGSQWPQMARGLLETSPAFAERISECAKALEPFVDYSLLDVLREEPGAPGLDRVDVVQPALWAVMVSLAGVWRSHGVEPDMVIGHSQGEIAAATAVGALSLSDGARVVALRSRAIKGFAGSGGMMSVAAPLEVVEAAVGPKAPHITVAAVNGPRSVVVSGERVELEKLKDELAAAGHRAKLIPVDYASHSVAVERIHDELLEVLAPIRPVSTPTLFISTLTGEPIDTAELDAGYWYRSLRHQVRFAEATRNALAHQCGRFIECSPHPVLVTAVEETIEDADREAVVIGTLRRDDGGPDRFRRALAEAYTCGASVDWASDCDVPGARLVDLPTYAFQRQRYWLQGQRRAITANTAGEPAVEPSPMQALSSRRAVRELVLGTAAGVLGHADAASLPPNRTFKDLGFESATSVDLRNRLRTATGLRLPTGLLFDYPTPDQLIDHLYAQLSEGRTCATVTAGSETAEAGISADADADADADPIVVVAMGCRYPGDVASPEELWSLVEGGVDAISEFPTNRGWDLDTLFATGPERSGTSDTRHGGFLHEVDQFDAAFFGISPREAAAMDPQQRLLLEICWETIERAGIDPTRLRGSSTGVFVGAMAPDYGPRLHQPAGAVEGHMLTGTALSVVSGRIAYSLGLQGQALTVDTACSSSLVAIVLAMQALRRGDCSLALAGGATVMSTPGMFVEFSRQSGLAPDGRCKAFSAGADGTGWGEGAGMLLLERLSDARRNGHPVLAVLRGGAVNQDGASNGLTAPNGQAQQEVIRRALADAGLTAADVDAVEAHGTGTTLGDPIEAESIIATYGDERDRPLWLGSLKSNVGHTQAAAGVGGVIKMVMAMRRGVLPRTLHADEPTPHVDWNATAVRLLTEPVLWPTAGWADQADRPARAAGSSFGISGTNAHGILEQAPAVEEPAEPAEPEQSGEPLVWVLSAKTAVALRATAQRLRRFAAEAPAADPVAAPHNLASRARFNHRAVVVAADRDELTAALAAIATGTPHAAAVQGVAADEVRPVFVFPGQGSQWVGMASELFETNEAFREQLRRCDEALAPHTGWSVIGVLRGDDGAPPMESSGVIQPALFAVMVSLSAVWRSLGVEPSAVVGHSQGEITAACAAGALSVQDAAKVVALRSKVLMQLTGSGGMLAVALPADQARDRLEPWSDRLWVAITNGPASTVVAGDPDALDELKDALGGTVRSSRLAIDYAAHTPHIEPLHQEILDTIGEVLPRPSDTAFCSALYADFIDHSELTVDYWFRGLRNQVRFDEAIRVLVDEPGTPLFVESSPHPVLTGHIQDTIAAAESTGGAVGSLRRGEGGWHRFLLAAAAAFTQGAAVDWTAALGARAQARYAEVPTYAFEHRRYWIDGATGSADVAATGLDASRHPLLGAVVPLAEADGFVLTGRLSRAAAPWLADHVVEGEVLLPGTAFVELALEAAAVAGCDEVEDLTLQAPVILPAAGAVQVQVTVGGTGSGEDRRTLTVHSRPAGDAEAAWTRHATGTLAVTANATAGRLTEWPAAGAAEVDLDEVYERLADRGYEYGPAFQGLLGAWRTETDAYVEVALPEPVRTEAGKFTLHPALLDAALHLLVLDSVAIGDDSGLLLPFSWSGVRVDALGAEALRVQITAGGDDTVSLAIHDQAGNRIARVEGLTLRRVPRSGGAPRGSSDLASYAVEWIEQAHPAAELSGQRWAVVGYGELADEFGVTLAKAGVETLRYYDLASLADMSAGEVPATVLVPYVPEPDADVPYAVRDGLYQALDLVQGWLGDERYAESRLVFVTRGAFGPQEVAEHGLIGGPVWGLVRSAQSEHPGRFALLDASEDFTDWGLVAAAVASGETQLVAREGTVSVPRLARRTSETSETGEPTDLGAGTVLITGGTGRLGGLVAQRLVQRCGARDLLIVSRRGAQAPGADELESRLTELGARVTLAACDVSDRYDLAALLDSIPADRPLRAVVHTAGVLDDATVEGLSAQRLDSVFAPKVDAAWYLHELTRESDLSAFVMFSSVAGVIGNPGQGNYAAANVFLDLLAAHRHGLGLPAVSVAWGLWSDEDAASGMTGQMSAADVARLGRSGLAGLTAEQGLDLLEAAIAAPSPLVVAAKWDPAGLRARAEADQLPPVLRGLVRAPRRVAATAARAEPAAAGPGGIAERLAVMAEPEARAHLAELVRSHVAAVLAHDSVDGVDVDRAFNELGFDSLTGVDLRNRLNAETGLRLPATVVFDHPTVSALAEYLYRSLAPEAPSPEDTLRSALERVESMLAAAGNRDGDKDAIRAKLGAILQSALGRLGVGSNGANTAAEKLDSASDEEIFALIDNEL